MRKKTIGLAVLVFLAGVLVWGCGQTMPVAVYQGIAITPEAASVLKGGTQQFRVNGLVRALSAASSAGTDEVIWQVSGGIGTIDATGLFTATAEGVGTVEARADSIVGRAAITVTAGRSISGQITDLTNEDPIAGALIYAGGKTTKSDSSGNYILQGISSDADSITVQTGAYAPTTIYTSRKSLINIELSLLPDLNSYPVGGYGADNSTISGEVRDESGNPSSMSVYFAHRYYGDSNGTDANGKFSIDSYIDPAKLPLQAFISAANSLKAGIKQVTITNTGAIDVGTLEVKSAPGTVTGEVVSPLSPSGSHYVYVGAGLMDAAGRQYPLEQDTSYYYAGNYTLCLPAVPSAYKYYLKAYAYNSSYTIYTSKYVDNFEIAPGETKAVDFSLPAAITVKSPTDGTISTGVTPVLSWTPPDSKFNLYLVFLYDSGGSGLLKWVGVTDQTSINYPSFPAGSGFENLNLENNKGYVWQVYGYYVPGFTLQASQVSVSAVPAGFSSSGSKAFSAGNMSHAMTVTEIKQALEQTMSSRAYFCAGSVQHVVR